MAAAPDDGFSPFLIDAAGTRGALTRLRGAYREVLSRHDYPPPLQRLLGELLAASVLLAVRPLELRTLTAATLPTRLFVHEEVTLFANRVVHFHCPCTRQRVIGALRLLGREEVEDLVRTRGNVEATCEFCNQRYRFDAADVASLFADATSATRH